MDAETDRSIPAWLVAQTAADVEELSRGLAVLEKCDKMCARTLAPIRRAWVKLSQDARYMREISGGKVRRAVRP